MNKFFCIVEFVENKMTTMINENQNYLEGHQTAHEAKIIGSICWTCRASYNVRMFGKHRYNHGRDHVENVNSRCWRYIFVHLDAFRLHSQHCTEEVKSHFLPISLLLPPSATQSRLSFTMEFDLWNSGFFPWAQNMTMTKSVLESKFKYANAKSLTVMRRKGRHKSDLEVKKIQQQQCPLVLSVNKRW